MNAAAWLSIVLVKSAVVVLAAGLVTLALRRHSASARHAVWAVALVALLMLPLLSAVLPALQWAILPSPDAPSSRPSIAAEPAPVAPPALPSANVAAASVPPSLDHAPISDESTAAPVATGPTPRTWRRIAESTWAARDRVAAYALFAWATGAAFALLRLVLGIAASRRLVRRATPLHGDWRPLLAELTAALGVTSPVSLHSSDDVTVPVVCGYGQSFIVLPREAGSWPAPRQRAFLMHELAHVQRRDCLTQAIAAIVRALYWPQPLVAWAVAQLRVEAEHACDDRVLIAGADAPDYAHHLLEAARALQPLPAGGGFAGIAERSNLERRLLALLDNGLQRGTVTRRALLAGAILGLAVTATVSALRPVARAAALQLLAGAPAAGPAGGARGDYDFWTLALEANSGKTRGTPANLNLAPVPGVHVQSQDGRLLAYTSNRSGRDEIWIRDFKTARDTALTQTADTNRATSGPVLSPDSRTVYYQSVEGLTESVYSVPTTGGEPKLVCNECGWPTDVSPDGSTLLVQEQGAILGVPGNPGDAAYAIDLATRAKVKILTHPDWTFWRTHFSPDGKWVSFHVGLRGPFADMGIGELVHEYVAPYRGAVPIAEREWIAITDGKAYSDAARWSPDGNRLYYVSDRDGARCIWSQRLDPATKKPVGDPAAVLHIHSPRHSLSNLGKDAMFPLGWLDLSVSPNKLIFSLGTPAKATWADVIAPGPLPPPSVVATAPPLPVLTGPAALKLPETFAGHTFSAWLDAFNSGDRGAMTRFREHFFLPESGDVDGDLDFRKVTGGFNFLRLELSEPTRIAGLIEERSTDQVSRFDVTVEATPPHRVTAIRLQGIPRPADLPTLRQSEAALLSDLRATLDRDTAQDVFAGTVLVAKDGKTVFSSAYGLADRENKIANTMETRFHIGMNKMFTAVAIMQLAEAGKLKLTDPIGRHLHDYPNPETASRVTIEQLLTHTGGTGDFFGPIYDEHRLELKTLDDYLKMFGTSAPLYEPGTRRRNSNYGFILLGAVIEKLSGQSYYDYVREHIFEPAGMTATDSLPESEHVSGLSLGYTKRTGRLTKRDNLWHSNADTLPYRGTPAGGGYSTAGDLLRFATALMHNKLVSAEGTRLLTTASKLPAADPHYGLGFEDQTRNGLRAIGEAGGAPGMNGDLRIYPDTGYVVVVLSNLDPNAASRISSFMDGRLPASR